MKRMRIFQNNPWGKGKSLEEEVNDFLKALDEAGIPDDDISIQITSEVSAKYAFVNLYVIWNHGIYAREIK